MSFGRKAPVWSRAARGTRLAKPPGMAPTLDKNRVLRNEQPVKWSRAFIVGFIGVSLMMAFVDICYMAGWTQFSWEIYVGRAFSPEGYAPRAWVVGLIANW